MTKNAQKEWKRARRVCAKCTRIGRRDGRFECLLAGCPPTLVLVRNASDYARLCAGLPIEPASKPAPTPPTLKAALKTAKKTVKPRVEGPVLSRSELSRLGALGRWAKWRAEKEQQEHAANGS